LKKELVGFPNRFKKDKKRRTPKKSKDSEIHPLSASVFMDG
jgi:hypothetical protein